MSDPSRLIADLIALEPIKTWSLIVTLFGDLAEAALTGSQIKALLGEAGIKPEAIRVALHRLKGDDWITSARRGRVATYALSAKGREETERAYADVYRSDVKFSAGWRFCLTNAPVTADWAVPLTKEVVLIPAEKGDQVPDSLCLHSADHALPAWIETQLVSARMRQNAAALARVLGDLGQTQTPPTLLENALLRLLILHHWRRLALRPSVWADISLVPEGTLAQCHTHVSRFLAQGARLSAAHLPA